MLKISYIIPVYNVEKYLAQCIDSIIIQTIDKEIIIIDDGSTDSSLKIAEKYKEKYKYIRIFSHQNKGVSITRNFGINVAEGEYVIFIDGDDWINRNCIQQLYELCTSNNLDILRWNYHMSLEENQIKRKNTNSLGVKYLNKVHNADEFFNILIETGKYEVFPWIGMYKREFLLSNHLYFPENIIMEDHLFTLKCLTKQNALVMQLNEDLYTYRRHFNSITTNRTIRSILDIKKGSELMLAFIEMQKFDERTYKNACKALSYLISNTAFIYGRLLNKDKRKCIELLPIEMLKFSIRYSISYKRKLAMFLFAYSRFMVNIIYSFKIKFKIGI